MRLTIMKATTPLFLMALFCASANAQDVVKEALSNAAGTIAPAAIAPQISQVPSITIEPEITTGQGIVSGSTPTPPAAATPLPTAPMAPAPMTTSLATSAPMTTTPTTSAPMTTPTTTSAPMTMSYSGPANYISPTPPSTSYGPMNIGEYPQGAACCNLAPTPTAIPCLKPVTSCCGQIGRLGVPPLSTPLRYDMPPVGKSVGRPLFGRWTGF